MQSRHLHRCMPVQLLDEPDHGKQIIPYHTGKVQIGIAYQPRLAAIEARAGSHHPAPRSPLARWAGWSVAAVIAVLLIARATA
jgi:hypothetical protein